MFCFLLHCMLLEKLRALGAAASWDSCGFVKRKSFREAGIPERYSRFVQDCSRSSEGCRLFKVLQSNACTHCCAYCVNSVSRAGFELSPREVVESFHALHSGGMVHGIFLSSAVKGSADEAMRTMIDTAWDLRERLCFNGYVHLKVLPEASKSLVFEMASLASRLSLNLEAPSSERLSSISSTKGFHGLLKRIRWIDEAKRRGLLGSFTTQFILGAADETDAELLRRMAWLYGNTSLHRVYFSAFRPVKGTALALKRAESIVREHRLYQADFLLRRYGFSRRELFLALDEQGNLPKAIDPKTAIALNNPNGFPVDVNSASFEELLRVPGIGIKAAEKIVALRRRTRFRDPKQLGLVGVALKRAIPFIELGGSVQSKLSAF